MFFLQARLGAWSPPTREQPELVGSLPFVSTGNSTHPRISSGAANHFDDSVQLMFSDLGNTVHSGTPRQAASGAVATTSVSCSLSDAASLLGEREEATRPFKTCRSLFNSDGVCLPATVNILASVDHVHSRSSAQPDRTTFGCFTSLTLAESSVAFNDEETARPCKLLKRADSSVADFQPFADMLSDNAGPSLHVPSPDSPAPACHSPAMLHSLTSGQVCTQFGSSSFLGGIVPEQSVSDRLTVQQMSHAAVDGPALVSQSCELGSVHVDSAAPNSDFGLPNHASPSASALTFTHAPDSPRFLAAATARPPGTAFSPAPSAACDSAPLPAFSTASKRRLVFSPGPRLAKRFKPG